MSDMINTLNLVADVSGSYLGRNANFSGEGSAHMEFETLAMSPADYEEWVTEVKDNAPTIEEEEFKTLLSTAYVGRKTFSSTHLSFSPPPGEHSEHMDMENGNMDHQENKEEHPTPATDSEETEFDAVPNIDPNEPLPEFPADNENTDSTHEEHTDHDGK
jgi:cytochrome aa3-600 menaquinol oxidase subunit 2